MYQTTIKLVYKYSEARLRLQSWPLLQFAGPWRYARIEIDTDILHYKYNMYHARIKLVYKYSEARLRLQSWPPRMCWALDIYKEGHPYRYITLQI